MKRTLLLLCLLIHAVCVLSQGYQKLIGSKANDAFLSVVQTKDGGAVMAGYTWLGYYDTAHMLITKADADGNIVWTKVFGSAGNHIAYGIIETTDGGYAIAGLGGSDTTMMCLLKLNAQGVTEWVRYYGYAIHNSALTVVQATDGGYYVGGFSIPSFVGTQAYLVRTDKKGTLIWSKVIFPVTAHSPKIVSMAATADNGVTLLANFQAPYAYDIYDDMYLIALKSDGNLKWASSVGLRSHKGGENKDVPKFLKLTSDNGYIFGGTTYPAYDDYLQEYMYVAKADSAGRKLWAKKIGSGNYQTAYGAAETKTGEYVITGSTTAPDGINYPRVYLAKLDHYGNLLDSKFLLEYPRNVNISASSDILGKNIIAVGKVGLSWDTTEEAYFLRFNTALKTCGTSQQLGVATDTGDFKRPGVFHQFVSSLVVTSREKTHNKNFKLSIICADTVFVTKKINVPPEQNLLVFPNPADDHILFNVDAPANTRAVVRIFNVTGASMQQIEINMLRGRNKNALNISSLKTGVYTLQVDINGKKYRSTFIKR